MSKAAPASAPPKRSGKTRAEREAEQAAKKRAKELANFKPIDPKVWMLVGLILLLIALWVWLDPMTFAEAQQGHNGGVIFAFPSALIAVFTKPPVVIVLAVVGVLPFLSGVIGWLRTVRRSSATNP